MIGEQDTFGINRNFGAPEETFSINLKKKKALCLTLHYNGENSHLFVNRKQFISLKTIIKMTTFQISLI